MGALCAGGAPRAHRHSSGASPPPCLSFPPHAPPPALRPPPLLRCRRSDLTGMSHLSAGRAQEVIAIIITIKGLIAFQGHLLRRGVHLGGGQLGLGGAAGLCVCGGGGPHALAAAPGGCNATCARRERAPVCVCVCVCTPVCVVCVCARRGAGPRVGAAPPRAAERSGAVRSGAGSGAQHEGAPPPGSPSAPPPWRASPPGATAREGRTTARCSGRPRPG